MATNPQIDLRPVPWTSPVDARTALVFGEKPEKRVGSSEADHARALTNPVDSPSYTKNWSMRDFYPATKGLRVARWELLKVYARQHLLAERVALDAAMRVSNREHVDLMEVLANVEAPLEVNDIVDDDWEAAATGRGVVLEEESKMPAPPRAASPAARATIDDATRGTPKTVPVDTLPASPAPRKEVVRPLPAVNVAGDVAATGDPVEQSLQREASLPPLGIGETSDSSVETSATSPEETSSSWSPVTESDATSTQPISAGACSPTSDVKEEPANDPVKSAEATCVTPRSRSASVGASVSVNKPPAPPFPPTPRALLFGIIQPAVVTPPAPQRVSIPLTGLLPKPRLAPGVSLDDDQADVPPSGRNKWHGRGAPPLR